MKRILLTGLILMTEIPVLQIYALDEEPPVKEEITFDMVIYQEGQPIEDSLILWEDSILKVSFTADVNEVEVMIDGDPFVTDIQENTLWIPVTTENTRLYISAIDSLDQAVERMISISSMQHLSATSSIKDKSYTLDPKVELQLDDICKENVEVQIQRDGQLINTIPCNGSKNLEILLDEQGYYQIQFVYKDHPEHKILIDEKDMLTFTFAKDPIRLNMMEETNISNHSISIPIQWPYAMQKGLIEIDDGTTTNVLEPIEILLLEGKPDEDITYKVTLSASDLFGRESQIFKEFRIDQKAPQLTLYGRNEVYEPNTLHLLTSSVDLNPIWSEEVSTDLQYFVNSVPVNTKNLNSVFSLLKNQDFLTVVFSGTDPAGNVCSRQYNFQFVKVMTPMTPPFVNEELETKEILKLEVIENVKEQKVGQSEVAVKKQEILGNYLDVRRVERVWSTDINQNVVLKKNEEEVIDKTKPIIRLYGLQGTDIKDIKLDSTLRLTLLHNQTYSDDRFEWIEINGEKINLKELKRDRLNNLYYDFQAKEPELTIKAKAKDQAGNVTLFEKTLQCSEEKNHSTWWVRFGIGTLLIGILTFVRIRLSYGKNKDTAS